MNNLSNQTYKELAIPYFKEVFAIIDEVLTQLNIPYYLIGVNAIALELLKDGIKPARGTKDIDFAIMIASVAELENVVENLSMKGFSTVKAPWTIYHNQFNTAIDLLPFGAIEENDTVRFHGKNLDLHVLGFKEVLEEAVSVTIEEKIAQIPPLHGMVILKLISWSDRPDERENDLYDILLIIQKYFEIKWDDIVTHHFDIFPEGELDPRLVACRVIGRKAAHILNKSPNLKNRLLKVLEENTFDLAQSRIAIRWAKVNDWTVSYATKLLLELKTGIEESV